MSREPTLYEVPADTPASTCKGETCRKEIYWIKTPAGKSMPIDCHAGAGCRPPALMSPGYGVPHWGTCEDRQQFHRQPAGPKGRA